MSRSSRKVSGCALVASALFALAWSSDAHAFCKQTTNDNGSSCVDDGAPLYWPGQCVGYRVSETVPPGSGFAAISAVIDTAFATWQSPICPGSGASPSLDIVDLGPSPAAVTEYNTGGPNDNLVYFQFSTWPHPGESFALTTVTFITDTGRILDADMEFDAADHVFGIGDPVPDGAIDLLSIATHEVGHFLGFADSDDPDATMNAVLSMDTAARDLAPDDVAAVCETYPPGGQRATKAGLIAAEPCTFDSTGVAGESCPSSTIAGCSTAPASHAAPHAGWLAAVGALFAATRRSRKTRVRRPC